MEELKFRIPLKVYVGDHDVPMNELDQNKISKEDIELLDGQYDWIEAWRSRDRDKEMAGFNNKDVMMEVKYQDGDYHVTLIGVLPFSTIVRSNRYYSSSPGSFKMITLKEAVTNFLEGCISDGIGENEIGQITYDGESCEVWMRGLEEI